MTQAVRHDPVLLEEAVEGLRPAPGDTVIDCTAGRGGHTAVLARHVGSTGAVLAIDADMEAVDFCSQRFAGEYPWVRCVKGNFRGVEAIWQSSHLAPPKGILIDAGISSDQLDDPGRGFSFLREGPLDMRMDRTSGKPLGEAMATWTQDELERMIREFGEERFAGRIARALCEARGAGALQTTTEAAEVIKRAVPGRYERGRIHPATRTFQALRIAVNRELEALGEAMEGALNILADGGRLAVISFHSLEDRLVKRAMREA
ncbi:MAG: 16S rRNA (cytosine(1402)-N(4))-methyltransferase RsmH, partial [Candidatus Omnitrophica bacterium]|nr:16S rRNA (cytosine(1402)-N(4))-methyltransferase RsmH [Candidatus Omnitrophota bacterium]